MDASKLVAGFFEARSENEFWLVFEDVCREALAWPGGVAVLVIPAPNPPVLCTMFFGQGPRKATVLRQLIEDDGAVFLEQDFTVQDLGDVRRSVRAGLYAIRVRDSNHQWHYVLSGAATARVFTEPMLPGRELGLSR